MKVSECMYLIGMTAIGAAQGPVSSRSVIEFDERSISTFTTRYRMASVEVQDPVYHSKKRYRGVWLQDILSGRSDPYGDSLYLLFRCKDGYSPVIPVARALRGKGLIALRDMEAPRGQKWLPLKSSAGRGSPGPAYLVWSGQASYSEEYPWPYQIQGIEIIAGADLRVIQSDPPDSRGYSQFVLHCIKCHAVNGVGGSLGPELNVPCSVTEYWDTAMLRKFIAQPNAVRQSSKMPSFLHLPDAGRDEILLYLQEMAKRKHGNGGPCK